jgi:hypothetical protein
MCSCAFPSTRGASGPQTADVIQKKGFVRLCDYQSKTKEMDDWRARMNVKSGLKHHVWE